MQDDLVGKRKVEEDPVSDEEDPISQFRVLSLKAREQVEERKRGGSRDWWPMSEELGELSGGRKVLQGPTKVRQGPMFNCTLILGIG